MISNCCLIAIFCASIVAAGTPHAATNEARSSAVSITAEVDRHSVALDGEAVLTVEVVWKGSADRYLFGWPKTPRTHHLSIVGSGRSAEAWVDDDGSHARQEFTYVLQPTDLGEASIGGTRLTFWSADDTLSAGQVLTTLPIELQITAPSDPPRRIPLDVLALALVVVAGIVAWRYRAARQARATAETQHAPDTSSELLAALARARSDGDVPAFYDAALAAVRSFAQERLGIDAARMGAADLARAIELSQTEPHESASVSSDVVAAVKDLLEQTDRRRYAPSRPEPWQLDSVEKTIESLLAGAGEADAE